MAKASGRQCSRQISEFQLEELEPRVLFSADLPTVVLGDVPIADVTQASAIGEQTHAQSSITEGTHSGDSSLRSVTELVIIDGGVSDVNAILVDLGLRTNVNQHVVVLDKSAHDATAAITQLSEVLENYQGLQAVHLISHGGAGELVLAGERVDTVDLLANAAMIDTWRGALAPGADLLVYGCDVASGSSGQVFVETLSLLSGADVAASTNLTGSEQAGGDWTFEVQRGDIQHSVAFSDSLQQDYQATFMSYAVTNLNDDGVGSLRFGINEANASADAYVISFTVSGTILLDSNLPTITSTITIDGGAVLPFDTPPVTLDGRNISVDDPGSNGGIELSSGSDNSVIRGLAIVNFPQYGIALVDSIGHTIVSNFIGTDGTNALGNGADGVYLQDSANNVIGDIGKGNVISGNSDNGIFLAGGGSTNNTIEANKIGSDASGLVQLGNRSNGIAFSSGANNNSVGGVAPSGANTISFNAGAGIAFVDSDIINNTLRFNTINGNGGLSIDLDTSNVTTNDSGDADTGANNLQNWAVLNSVSISDAGTFTYDIDTSTLAFEPHTIDFYASTNLNGGQVEAERYLGTLAGVLGGNNSFTGDISAITLALGEYVVLVTTDSDGNSSELSNFAVVVEFDPGGTTPSDLQATATTRGGLSINSDGGNDTQLVVDDGAAILGSLNLLSLELDVALRGGINSALFHYESPGSDNEFRLLFSDTGKLFAQVNNNVNIFTNTVDSIQFNDGVRRTIGITWDGVAGDLSLYVDGKWQQTISNANNIHTLATDGVLVFGNDQTTTAGGARPSFASTAEFYRVRVFNEIRTDEQLAASFSSELPFNEDGMVAQWAFDHLSSDGVITDSVSGNNVSVQHILQTGFAASDASLTFELDENSLEGTLVGQVSGVDAERNAVIASLLAADEGLRYNAETDKFYKVDNGLYTPTDARTNAESTSLNGVNGQLVTIRSAAENQYVAELAYSLTSSVWIGATDSQIEGEWRWIESGREADLFWLGSQAGYAVDGAYQKWAAGSQPNQSGDEDWARVDARTGRWIDSSVNETHGFVVEWNADDVLDASQALSYAITSRTVAGAFAIDASRGKITVADASLLDFESNSTHTLSVATNDGKDNTYEESFSVSLNDLVERDFAPTDLSSGIDLNTDGGNDAYLIADNGASILGGLTQFTFESQFSITQSDVIYTPLISYDAINNANEFRFGILSDGRFNLQVDEDFTVSINTYPELLIGDFHHVALSWDSTTGEVALYVDGKFVERLTGIAAGAELTQFQGTLVLGQDQKSSSFEFSDNQVFSGTLYDVRIWDEVRSEANIKLNYQHKFDSSSLPAGLLANWQMDGFNGSGEVVDVVSANNFSVGHAIGTNFITSTPVDNLHINESASIHDSVGFVVPSYHDLSSDLLSDGQFLKAADPGGSQAVSDGGAIGDWTVSGDGVSLVASDFESPNGGGRSVSLSDSGGAITQTLNTVSGQQYHVVFEAAGDFRGGETVKNLRVSASGQSSDFALTEGNDWSLSNMSWENRSLTFTATSSTTQISFLTLDTLGTSYGPAVGNIRVAEVPQAISTILNNDSALSYDAATGKFYRFVNTPSHFDVALSAATTDALNGVSGKLLTIDSGYENQLIRQFVLDSGNPIWLGASDETTDGVWNWLDGISESDETFWTGGKDGGGVDGIYSGSLWLSDAANEFYLRMNSDGRWADTPNESNFSYVVEWDASEVLSSSTYALVDASKNFKIDSNSGEISVAPTNTLDFETANLHNVDVTVTNSAGDSYSETVTIIVDDDSSFEQSVPVAQNIDEDQVLSFSSGSLNAVTVTKGPFASNTPLQVALSVNDGVLTLMQTTGLSISEGSNGSSFLTIQGTESALNAALEGMTFSPDENFNGTVVLSVTTSIGTDLVGHYSFDVSNDSGSARDTSAGTVQAGTLNGDAAIITDPERGEVLSLGGAGSVDIAGLYDNPSDVTLAAWVNLSAADTSGGDVISLGNNVVLRLDQSQSGTGVTGFYRGDDAWFNTASNQFIAGTGWHHVAYTVDDTNNIQRIYIDGTLFGETNVADSTSYSQGSNTIIGAHGNSDTLADFVGLIDEARVYTRALSADEIRVLAADEAELSDSVVISVASVNDAPDDIALANPVGANLLSNGSFETNSGDANTASEGVGVSINGWTPIGDEGFQVWNNFDAGGPGAASDGQANLVLNVQSAVNGIAQSVSTVANQAYVVSVDVSNIDTNPSSEVEVYWSGDLVGTITQSAVAWQTHSFVVTGSGSDELRFVETATNNSTGSALLDNVRLLVENTPTISVSENAANGTIVAFAGASDVDTSPVDTRTYSLADDASGRFEINSTNGVIRVVDGSLLNFETATSHNITVRVTDSSAAFYEENFIVEVIDVVEGPRDILLVGGSNLISNSSFESNADGWTLTGEVSRTDINSTPSDGVVSLTFSKQQQPNTGVASTTIATEIGKTYAIAFEAGTFGLDLEMSLQLTVTGSSLLIDETVADRGSRPATNSSYQYTFIADSGTTVINFADTSSITDSVDIAIDNIRAFEVNSTRAINVAENSANSTLVAQVFSTAQDDNKSITYSLIDDAGGRFSIDANSGVISVANGLLLDHETASSHHIIVLSGDGSLTTSETFTVNTIDVNEAPVFSTSVYIENSGFEVDVLNDAQPISFATGWTTSGSLIGTWNPVSEVYSGEAPEGQNVGFIDDIGTFSQTTMALFTENTDYELTVAIGDANSPQETDAWEIRLYAGAQLLGTASNVDVNPANDTFADVALFITSEQLALFSANYGENIRVEIYDAGTSDNLHFDNVRLTQTSSVITTPTVTYIESGVAVNLDVNLKVFDEELSSVNDFGGVSLNLMRSAGANSEDVFSATGNLLFNAGTLELSSTAIGSYTNVGGELALTFAAGVTNAQINEVVQSIAYTNNNDFPTASIQIDWILKDGNSDAQSSGVGQALASTIVDIVAVNDAPTNTGSFPADISVIEDVLSNIDLSSIEFSDVDAGNGELTVTLSTSNDGQLTTAVGAGITLGGTAEARTLTGTLTDLNSYFDTPSNIQYLHVTANITGNDADTLQVAVNDGGNSGSGGGVNTSLGVVNIDIEAANDVPVAANNTVFTIEDTDYTFSIADFNFSDIEGGTLASVRITTLETVGALQLNGIDVNLNQVIAEADISAEKLKYVPLLNQNGSDFDSFGFSVNDGVSDSATSYTMTLDVLASIDAPTLVEISNSTLQENTDTRGGVSVGTLSSIDADRGEIFSYSVLSGLDAAVFSIGGENSDELVLTAGVLDFEIKPQYSVSIRVTDSAGLTHDQLFSVSVEDINEAPVVNNAEFDVSTGYEGFIGQLEATDPDTGDRLVFQLVAQDPFSASDTISLSDDGVLSAKEPGAGIYQFEIKVIDSQGLEGNASLILRVESLESGAALPELEAPAIEFIEPESKTEPETEPTEPTEIEETISTSEPIVSSPTAIEESTSGAQVEIASVLQIDGAQRLDSVTMSAAQNGQIFELFTERSDVDQNESSVSSTSFTVSSRVTFELLIDTLTNDQSILSGSLMSMFNGSSAPLSFSIDLIDQLDRFRLDTEIQETEGALRQNIVIATGTVVTATLSVGFATWLIQSGLLMASAISTTPLWRGMDPMPILMAGGDVVKDDLDTSLDSAKNYDSHGRTPSVSGE